MADQIKNGDPFSASTGEGHRHDLVASLFEIRATGELGPRDDDDAPSLPIGLRLGSAVAARPADNGSNATPVLDPMLARPNVTAIEAHWREMRRLDRQDALIIGIPVLEPA